MTRPPGTAGGASRDQDSSAAVSEPPSHAPEIYSDATGAAVVVANSLVIAQVLGVSGRTGTAIAVAPGEAAVGHAAEPEDVVVFLLDAGAPSVAHERGG